MPRSRTSLKSVRKAVEKAATAINSNSLAKEASKGIADLDKLCSELRRLEAVPKGRRPSLIEYLAGSSLPVIYELEFRTKPTPTRDGSFVKFAGAALEAFGLRCSPETIIKGLTAFRKADGQKTK